MLTYILKRILIFIPTILIISLITFGISTNAPGDPVEQMLAGGGNNTGQSASLLASEKAYLELRKKLGLDLPIFYFSFSNSATPDTIHRIPKRLHRQNLSRLVYDYGNWDKIEGYYKSIRQLELAAYDVPKDDQNATALIKIKDAVNALYMNHKTNLIDKNFNIIDERLGDSPSLAVVRPIYENVKSNYQTMVDKSTTWKNYIPSLKFYGTENQYHRWFFGDKPWFRDADPSTYTGAGFIRGDFGISYQDQRPVGSVIWDAVKITMMISFISIIITYMIAIPIGVFSARRKGSVADQTITTILFVLYSLPSFWLATLAIVFLCGGDYLDIFPPYGLGEWSESNSLFQNIKTRAYHLILPLILWTYGSFTYLSRQMRGGMLSVLGQDYIRTARAKGLPEDKVIWKHTMRNSMLPVITLFASVFPLMISGAIVLEIIFSIPGMGKVAFEAIVARNYPIVFSVMMFSCMLTLVGYLVSDILYAVVDPRISYSGGKK